jgi:hypothetical protein
MKYAAIYSVRSQAAHGFVWKWRSDDHVRRSSMAFVIYEDCVADARQSGYTVVTTPPDPS